MCHVIRRNDVLLVMVIGLPDMSGFYPVVDGRIAVPTIGDVRVAGLTLAQVRTRLAKALSIKETRVVVR